MGNFDKIYNTWKNIESTYRAKGDGKTRKEFIEALIGTDEKLVKLRSLMMKDYDGSEEAIYKINDLFGRLKNAKELLSLVPDVENLDVLIWGTDNAEESEIVTVDLDSYCPCKEIEYCDSKSLINSGFYGTVYQLVRNKVKMSVVQPDDKNLIRFDQTDAIVGWLQQHSDAVVEDSKSFTAKVYAFLVQAIVDRNVKTPIAFVNGTAKEAEESGEESKAYPTLDKRKFQCNFKWDRVSDKIGNGKVVFCHE